MPSRNLVLLEGHLGADAEVKHFPTGSAVVEFRMATTEKWQKNGEWNEDTTWHKVKFWPRNAEHADKLSMLQKGDLVSVEGKIKTEKWEKDGQPRSKTIISARDVHFLRHKNGHGEATQGSGTPDDDDLPF